MQKTVLIVGLGLIGSSIALGIRRGNPELKIIGYNRRQEPREIAVSEGIVDLAFGNFQEAAEQADIIFLCVPIKQTIEMLASLASFSLRADVLVTDAGSTKLAIVRAAEGLPFKFVGGHPMAGSHKSGVLAADVNLFENAYYVFTEKSPELENLLRGLHAKYIVMAAEEHDAVTSQVSHFPHVLASSLVQQSDSFAVGHPLVKNLAAGGFRDMTRIAESDSAMWVSILLSNPAAILARLEDFKGQLDLIGQKIANRDEEGIRNFFEKGKQIRQAMEIHQGNRGAIPNFYDLFISVPDKKGVILRVLALLQDISITNIKINEDNREDIHGQLQVSFKNETDLLRARKIIETATDFVVE